MATAGVLAQAAQGPNQILPSSNETVWGAISVIATVIVVLLVVVLVVRYFRRLRRSAEEAATRAGATEREVAALRAELRERSA